MSSQSPVNRKAKVDHSLIEAIRTVAARAGLNLVAAIPAQRYDLAVAPAMRTTAVASVELPAPPRSIVLIGNGGGDFWRAFSEFADRQPGWRDRAHPLDDFTREIIERDVVPAVRHQARDAPRYIRSYRLAARSTLSNWQSWRVSVAPASLASCCIQLTVHGSRFAPH